MHYYNRVTTYGTGKVSIIVKTKTEVYNIIGNAFLLSHCSQHQIGHRYFQRGSLNLLQERINCFRAERRTINMKIDAKGLHIVLNIFELVEVRLIMNAI